MPKYIEITEPLANVLWHTGSDHGPLAYPAGYEPFEGILDPCDPIFEGGFDMWCSSVAAAVLLCASETAAGWTATLAWMVEDLDSVGEEVLVVTNNPSRRLDRQATPGQPTTEAQFATFAMPRVRRCAARASAGGHARRSPVRSEQTSRARGTVHLQH